MFTTIKAKLIALIAVAGLAIVLLAATSFHGLNEKGFWVNELGKNLLPSVNALQGMKEAITDARRSSLEAVIWEHDYSAQK